jgi:hypothetical protein
MTANAPSIYPALRYRDANAVSTSSMAASECLRLIL